MKVKDWLATAEETLRSHDVPTARLDALVLLEDAMVKDRSWLLANPDKEINKEIMHKLTSQIERRATHEPLAYIRGKSEFYGREFNVSAATLQPRPETETLIDLLLHVNVPHNAVLADIGTGSGCIAITAALELPGRKVVATELNKDALALAQQNAATLSAAVAFFNGDLLLPIKRMKIDVLLANLPYVPDHHTINESAMFEPKMAIFGGKDGLSLYRTLFSQLHLLSRLPRLILTESLPFQHTELANIAHANGYALKNHTDFIQMFEKA